MIKSPVEITAQPATYQELLNAIDKSEAGNEYLIRHKRLHLAEQPFFSKNQIDAAVSHASTKHSGYNLLSFLLGLSISVVYILLHIK